ncbi:UPF0041 domain protein [Aspergillus sp. HF37]|nr:UPF0041 domain protein [Aspergillus sp. HF37]
MSSRVGMRFSQSFRSAFRNAYGPFRRQGAQGRRFQSSEAGEASQSQSTFQRVADFARPAEKLSLTQNAALMATGAIWTRWCLIIKPRNVMLAAVNFFLGCVGVVQCSRIFLYQRSLQGSSAEAAKELEHEVADSAKSVAEKTENAVERS